MANVPDPIPQPQLDALFPLHRPVIKEGAFELGLVLGGTVSAGAYSAGVIDYLLEALDAWTLAKEQLQDEAPRHEVVISTIAGASGGAVNAAIITRAAGFSHPRGASDANPFYTAWTGVDLMALLSAAPESGVNGFASVLNCAALDQLAASTIGFKGGALGAAGSATPRARAYFADPLRVMMTLGNITGVPYRIDFSGATGLGLDLIDHSDFNRFALTIEGGVPASPQTRPDEFALSSAAAPNWDRLRASALATCAFPIAFRARPIARPMTTNGYRVAMIPGDDVTSAPKVVQLLPIWNELIDGEANPAVANFTSVDGGTVDNDPIDLVRTSLAGLAGRNPRDGTLADRAVVLVAPFADPVAIGQRAPPGVVDLAMPFVMSLVYQARFRPADIALAQDPEIYSRYLVAPRGPVNGATTVSGQAAIASGGLGGFLGFVDKSFLKYDYLLGRRNAYEFLNSQLALPETNRIFAGWSDAQKADQTVDTQNGVRYLRLIPLMRALRDNPPPALTAADWPALDAMPAALGDAISARLDTVYQSITTGALSDSWWKQMFASTYLKVGWTFARPALRDRALQIIKSALQTQKLLPPDQA